MVNFGFTDAVWNHLINEFLLLGILTKKILSNQNPLHYISKNSSLKTPNESDNGFPYLGTSQKSRVKCSHYFDSEGVPIICAFEFKYGTRMAIEHAVVVTKIHNHCQLLSSDYFLTCPIFGLKNNFAKIRKEINE